MVFPTKESAQRAQRFVEKRYSSASRIASFRGLQALAVSAEAYEGAMLYWRFSGEVVSSRMAEDTCRTSEPGSDEGFAFTFWPRSLFVLIPDLFLYESGMAAFFSIHRAVTGLAPAKKTLQLDFPYVDALKVQENFGSGVVFCLMRQGSTLTKRFRGFELASSRLSLWSLPSNPLLSSVDLLALADAAKAGRTPVIADDTVVSHHNVEVFPHVDAVTTSLTKWISGKGDVTGGAIRINPDSPFRENLLAALEESNPTRNRIYAADSRVLKGNAEGFPRRMKVVNRNGEAVAEMLKEHPGRGTDLVSQISQSREL